jgi:hypothetical protein
VTPLEMDLPLSAFQATLFQKDDVYKLIKSIYLSLDKQLLNEQELERQFNRCWPDIESQLKILLSSPFEGRNELQDLTEELLLPVIYRETNQGDLETVFEWLRIAKSKGVANLEGHLGFVEASLARITGKRQAPASLKQLSIQNTIYSSKAQLELLFYYFASDHRLSEVHINIELINNYPESIRRTCYAVLSLWNLHENNNEIAKWLFEKAEPNRITSNVADYYRSIPMGILCFAFGNGELGEKYFDLTRNILLNNEGYPFVSLLAPFDRKFINTCIGYEGDQDSEKRIRERIRDFRGHCWVLIKYADFLCENENALQSLISRTLLWKKPLTKESIVNKLKSLQKEFISFSGRPLLYQKEG